MGDYKESFGMVIGLKNESIDLFDNEFINASVYLINEKTLTDEK